MDTMRGPGNTTGILPDPMPEPRVSAPDVLAAGLGAVRGVLFDIDDTLVDLEFAMTTALRDVSEHLLPGLDEAGWERFDGSLPEYTEEDVLKERDRLRQASQMMP